MDAKRGLGVVANRKILLVPVVEHRSLIHNRFSPYLLYARICLDTGATRQLRMIYAKQQATRGHANKENGIPQASALITDISGYIPSPHISVTCSYQVAPWFEPHVVLQDSSNGHSLNFTRSFFFL